MKTNRNLLIRLMKPVLMPNIFAEIITAIPRIICGGALAFSFGADKFGMPWTSSEIGISLFEVVEWFPKDVAKYGGLFTLFPVFFAWMSAFSEAIGGLCLMLGLQTRISAFLIMCTMLVAIFFEKWGGPVWHMLPALGFLWVSLYALVLGSGKIGIDYLLAQKKQLKMIKF